MKIHSALIEPLEERIAPASLTFIDVDGDKVRVTVNSPGALFTTKPSGLGEQLTRIDITSGTHVNVTVAVIAKGPLGDGQVNVGQIATPAGVTLGSVTVPGDLGQIVVSGTGTATDMVLQSLKVRSMGEFGNATGAVLNGNSTLESIVGGSLGSLTVTGDVNAAYLDVTGKIGSVAIGGSLVGGSTSNSGEILSGLAMGPVKIGNNVYGGSGASSGSIVGDAGIASVTVGKSVLGASGPESGYIVNNSSDTMGPVKIGGNLESGTNSFSGTINSFGNMGPVVIGGSIIGGDTDGGSIFMQMAGGSIASVKVGGNMIGGFNANDSGSIASLGSIGAVTIGGSVTGGGSSMTNDSGSIEATGNLGFVTIGGDLQFGRNVKCGYVSAGGSLAGLRVDGWSDGLIEVTGNIGTLNFGSYFSGTFESTAGSIKSVSIAGDLMGQNDNSAAEDIGSIFIGGSISQITSIDSTGGIIGALVVKGSVETDSAFSSKFAFGSVKIGGNLDGTISSAEGAIGTVTVKGDMTNADVLSDHGGIGAVKVGGSVTDSLLAAGLTATSTEAVAIGSISVKGDWVASSVTAGFKDTNNNGYGNDDDALIAKSGTIGSIVIGGEVIGTVTPTTDHFGFDAQDIGAFDIGGNSIRVGSTPGDITLSETTGGDVAIHIAQA